MRAVQFVLDSTYFTFDNIIYKQNFGAPMGSPLFPIIADVVMQDLENEVLSLISILFFYRYVDDIIMAIPVSKINILFSINLI